MRSTYQRGSLSLLWTAVFVGIAVLAGMAVLLSARYERNYFAEAWERVTKAVAGWSLPQVADGAPASQIVRRCTENGTVVYSNVECDTSNPTSQAVSLHDTKGVEAPKTLPAALPQAEASPPLQSGMIDKATGR